MNDTANETVHVGVVGDEEIRARLARSREEAKRAKQKKKQERDRRGNKKRRKTNQSSGESQCTSQSSGESSSVLTGSDSADSAAKLVEKRKRDALRSAEKNRERVNRHRHSTHSSQNKSSSNGSTETGIRRDDMQDVDVAMDESGSRSHDTQRPRYKGQSVDCLTGGTLRVEDVDSVDEDVNSDDHLRQGSPKISGLCDAEESSMKSVDDSNQSKTSSESDSSHDKEDYQDEDHDNDDNSDVNHEAEVDEENIDDDELSNLLDDTLVSGPKPKPVNVGDLLQDRLPESGICVDMYCSEVVMRAEHCMKRNQHESALQIIEYAIASKHYFNLRHNVSNTGTSKDSVLTRLYLDRMHCLASLKCKDKNLIIDVVDAVRIYGNLKANKSTLSELIRECNKGDRRRSGVCDINHALNRMGNYVVPDYVATKIEHHVEFKKKQKTLREKMTENAKLSDSIECRWSHYVEDGITKCDNCHRHKVYEVPSSIYYFDLYTVYCGDLYQLKSPLKKVQYNKYRKDETSDDTVTLCSECHNLLCRNNNVKKRDSWSNVWPSFYWDLLTGSDVHTKLRFYDVYSPTELWKFIPSTARLYWRDEIMSDDLPYQRAFTENHESNSELCSHFVDRTEEVTDFWKNISKYTFKGMLEALDPARLRKGVCNKKSMVLPDVLCPWGCTEFSFRCRAIEPSIILQHLLPKVNLNMTTSSSKLLFTAETSRLDYIRRRGESIDYVLLNKHWPVMPTMCMVRDGGFVICTCRHHDKNSTKKRLYCHPPRKPTSICNLSSSNSDQLSHAVIQQRIIRPVTRKGQGTTPTSTYFKNSYAGADSADVTIGGRFDNRPAKFMSSRHESLSFDREDIRLLAERYVSEGIVHEELANEWRLLHDAKYPTAEKRSLTRGATYTPTWNAIELQRAASKGVKIKVIARQKKQTSDGEPYSEEREYTIKRCWSPAIYNVQVDDGDGFGWRFKAIPSMKGLKKTSSHRNVAMLTWVMLGCVSGCKQLYGIVDNRQSPHRYNNFSGHLLYYIHHQLMKHCDSISHPKSPFAVSSSVSELCKHIKGSLSLDNVNSNPTFGSEDYFLFGRQYLSQLFPPQDYPSVLVTDSISNQEEVDGKELVILVTKNQLSDTPSMLFTRDNDPQFELRLVIGLCTKSKSQTKSPTEFEAIRLVRHGKGYMNWWEQRRDAHVMIQRRASSDADDIPILSDADLPGEPFRFVYIFVRKEELRVDEFRMDMHLSVGGQSSVYCDCQRSGLKRPLLPTSSKLYKKVTCSVDGCDEKESFYCPHCPTKLCDGCCCRIGPDGGNTLCPICDVPLLSTQDRIDAQKRCSTEGCKNRERYVCQDCRKGPCGACFKNKLKSVVAASQTSAPAADGGTSCGENVDDSAHIEAKGSDSAAGPPHVHIPVDDVRDDEDSIGEDSEAPPSDEASCCSSEAFHGCNNSVNTADVDDGSETNNENSYPNNDVDLCGLGENDEYEYDCDGGNLDLVTNAIFDDTQTSDGPDVVDEMSENGFIPRIDCSRIEVPVLSRNEDDNCPRAPMHVLFNQLGRMLQRGNKAISGNLQQQNFVQRMVSTVVGVAIPVLFYQALLFPKHFWASSVYDRTSVMGCPPISCYRGTVTHPDGFASTLERARNLMTHSSSSTATDDRFTAHSYDMQANIASNGVDSRIISKSGFRVDSSSSSGLKVGERDQSDLKESMESAQGMLNLGAAAHKHGFDLFITATCNQSKHPGIRHLHQHKESKEWTSFIEGYDVLPCWERDDINISMEMAYTNILTRSWLEVRKLYVRFIMISTSSILKKVKYGFFRDEYQESSGNLSHIHALIALCKADMENEEFANFLGDLQKNSVGEIVPAYEIASFVEKGLLLDDADWKEMKACAETVLPHSCASRRCLVRTGPNPEDEYCKKIHPVFGSKDPLENEYHDIPVQFSASCLKVLERTGHYTPPSDGEVQGHFNNKMFTPKRHVGKVLPSARENMSPVMAEHFALTRSSQNMQVVYGTNGVTRYVVKYIIKIDKCNRAIVWADSRSDRVLRVEHNHRGNTKITSNAIHERKSYSSSRKVNLPTGRTVGIPQMMHQLMADSEIETNITFEEVSTLPFEYRGKTKIHLDRRGNVRKQKRLEKSPDCVSPVTVSYSERQGFTENRRFTATQRLLLQSTEHATLLYDKVCMFSLRPPELRFLFRRLGQYFEWFDIDKEVLSDDDVRSQLHKDDIKKCHWIDGFGRKVLLRKCALPQVVTHLRSLRRHLLPPESQLLLDHLLDILLDSEKYDRCPFVVDDGKEDPPVVVFSKVVPEQNMKFILHILLVLGEYDTELDLKQCTTLKEAFELAELIPRRTEDERDELKGDVISLVRRVIDEIIPVQPITIKRLDTFVVKTADMLESIILHNNLPMMELPPCLSTELHDVKTKELENEWSNYKRSQLRSMMEALADIEGVPTEEEVMKATKNQPIQWDPLQVLKQTTSQNEESYKEQQFALSLGIAAVHSYMQAFGQTKMTKGILNNGAPGAGKTWVLQTVGFYGMSQGMKVMSSSLMAIRAGALGGCYLHNLFKFPVNRSGNLFRYAEDILFRRKNLILRHILMTMDMLLLDECGQMSSQQLATIDIILRHLRGSTLPFGGVLICGSFDHRQLECIGGLPFLLSSHILTDFTLVKLEQSVRAAKDKKLQEIQNITRLGPTLLSDDYNSGKEKFNEFKTLLTENVKFVSSFDELNPNTYRMYHRKKSAVRATDDFIDTTKNYLTQKERRFVISDATDKTKLRDDAAGFKTTKEDSVIDLLNRKVRESRRLIFFEGALFEATRNSTSYKNSQILIMLEVPSEEDVKAKKKIKLYASPPGSPRPKNLYHETPPTAHEVEKEWGWKQVFVDHAEEKCAVRSDDILAYRCQYTMVHLGASTVNKTMGCTLDMDVALEVTTRYHPWESGQVVVGLSRTTCCKQISIVTDDPDFAIDKLFRTLCKSNQWSAMVADIVDNMSVSYNSNANRDRSRNVLNLTKTYPLRIADYSPPTSNTGNIYMLLSSKVPEIMYIGQTGRAMNTRLTEHNQGRGAKATNVPELMPWAIGAFITGLGALSQSEREKLEAEWKGRNERSPIKSIQQVIDNGSEAMHTYNDQEANPNKHLKFVICVSQIEST